MAYRNIQDQRNACNNHYQNNKEDYIRRSKERRQAVERWFVGIKKSLICVNCGEDCPACLDLHHLDPNEKEGNVRDIFRSRSAAAAIAELEKCVSLCANCHRKAHKGLIELKESDRIVVDAALRDWKNWERLDMSESKAL